MAGYGPSYPKPPQLLSSDDITLHNDKESITEWWREHFSNLLNRPSTAEPAAVDLIPDKAIMDDLDLPSWMRPRKQLSRPPSANISIDGLPAKIKAARS